MTEVGSFRLKEPGEMYLKESSHDAVYIYIYLLVSVAGRTGIHEIKTKGAEEGEGGLEICKCSVQSCDLFDFLNGELSVLFRRATQWV